MGPSGTWKPAVRSVVSWADVDGDIVVIDENDGVHVLESTGALLWQLLDGTATMDEIAEDVAVVFGVESDIARRDVIDFVSRMFDSNLLNKYEAAASSDS